MDDRLTRSTLLHFFYGRPKDIKHLHHYLYHHIRHRRSRWHRGINFESPKEIFDALEDIDKDLLARFNVVGRLKTSDVTRVLKSELTRSLA